MTPSNVILVVDDDPFMREITRIHLESAGYSVALAESGAEGVEKAINIRPSAVIMDYAMPGVSGAEALKQLRSHAATATTPVLMLSAWSSPETQREAEHLGAAWLEKPVIGEALIEALRRLKPQ